MNADIIQLLKREQGSKTQKELAKRIGVTDAYLSDVLRGNRQPGKAILQFFELEKVVTYRKASGKGNGR